MGFHITSFMFFIISLSLVFGFNQFAFNVPFSAAAIAGLTAFLICWKFNKGRAGFAALLFTVIFFNGFKIAFFSVPQGLFMFFITLNVFMLSVSKERGVFSIHGLKKTGVFIVQLFILYLAFFIFPAIGADRGWFMTVSLTFLGTAVIKAVFFDKDPANVSALGSMMAMVITAGIGIDINGIQSIMAPSIVITGVIFAVYSTSYIDELTGLPGRRAYNEYCAQLSSDYTIAMTDIDHFKNFNDTYGHDTGDEVLKLVAKIISTVGGGGRAFRFGGEEFVIVFDGTDKESTIEFLEEIRIELEKTPFTVRNKENRSKYEKTGKKMPHGPSKTVNITMSIGVADSKKDNDPVKVMKKADTALYKAKNAGRNRVST